MIGRITLAAALAASPLAAQEHRELGAHEHGVGQLNMAIEGDRVLMELHAPGADIAGFEHRPDSDSDRAAVEAAVAALARPLELFDLPAAAGCTVVEASAELVAEPQDAHDGHDDHASHDGHGEGGAHADHDDHAEHDAHDAHEEHEEHAGSHGDDHEHGEADAHHDDEGRHSEFHAEYVLNCASPSAIDSIGFAYFEQFPNAREIELQMVTDKGAGAFEIHRDAPVLDLAGHI